MTSFLVTKETFSTRDYCGTNNFLISIFEFKFGLFQFSCLQFKTKNSVVYPIQTKMNNGDHYYANLKYMVKNTHV